MRIGCGITSGPRRCCCELPPLARKLDRGAAVVGVEEDLAEVIPLPPFLAANWRAIAMLVVVGALGAGLLWYRGEAAQAELEVAEFRHAYDTLARSVQTQNAEVNRWKETAEKAQQRAATARTKAAPVVEASKRSSEALGAAMRGLRPAECPTAKAAEVVRSDLEATLR